MTMTMQFFETAYSSKHAQRYHKVLQGRAVI